MMRCDVTPYDFVKVIPDEFYSLNLHLTFSWILRVPVHGLITHDVTFIPFATGFIASAKHAHVNARKPANTLTDVQRTKSDDTRAPFLVPSMAD
jgi:hypothetical protein